MPRKFVNSLPSGKEIEILEYSEEEALARPDGWGHGGQHQERGWTIDKVRQIYPLVLVALGVILLVLGIFGWLNVV